MDKAFMWKMWLILKEDSLQRGVHYLFGIIVSAKFSTYRSLVVKQRTL